MSDVTISPVILELMASRICHDLVSPIGAVNNGVEFLEEMGAEAGGEAVELIAMSARIASARLQLFRLAYGAGGRDPGIKPEFVQKIFGEYVAADGKVRQMWDPYGPLGPHRDLPGGFCKILSCLLMLAVECLPRGGSVTVEPSATGTRVITEGQDSAPRENMASALSGEIDPEALDPRLVHAGVTGALARSYGFEAYFSDGAGARTVIDLRWPA